MVWWCAEIGAGQTTLPNVLLFFIFLTSSACLIKISFKIGNKLFTLWSANTGCARSTDDEQASFISLTFMHAFCISLFLYHFIASSVYKNLVYWVECSLLPDALYNVGIIVGLYICFIFLY